MNRLRQILKDQRGVAFPLIIAIVLVLVMLMCCISEYFRLLIVAQGVRDAVQEAVISTVNDNYDDVYHSVREGYSGAYQPLAGDFEESLDYHPLPAGAQSWRETAILCGELPPCHRQPGGVPTGTGADGIPQGTVYSRCKTAGICVQRPHFLWGVRLHVPPKDLQWKAVLGLPPA